MSQGPLHVNLDLSNVRTAYPLIAKDKMVLLVCTDLGTEIVKDGDTVKGPAIVFQFTTDSETRDIDDNIIAPGFKLTAKIQCYAKADATDPTWYLKKLSKWIDALLLTGDKGNSKGLPERPPFNDAIRPHLLGKKVWAKMGVRQAPNSDAQFNEIVTLIHPSEMKHG